MAEPACKADQPPALQGISGHDRLRAGGVDLAGSAQQTGHDAERLGGASAGGEGGGLQRVRTVDEELGELLKAVDGILSPSRGGSWRGVTLMSLGHFKRQAPSTKRRCSTTRAIMTSGGKQLGV